MALINKDNENKASTVTFEDKLEDHHYSKMFISCSQIQQSVGDISTALKGLTKWQSHNVAMLWKELKIDKSTKINIE